MKALRGSLAGVAIVTMVLGGLLLGSAAHAAPLVDAPHLTLAKTAAPAFSAPPKVGDQIAYSFTITNDGTAALSDVAIVDALPGLSPITYTWPGASGVLNPGDSATAAATYLITQVDINKAGVINSAIASGITEAGANVSSTDVRAVVEIDRVSSMALVKSADTSGVSTPAQPGDPVVYTFTVTNTGNITIKLVTITDQLSGLPPLTYTWPGVPGVLNPNQSVTAIATYPISTADVIADRVVNTATASGIDVAEAQVTSNQVTLTTPLTAPLPNLALSKTATPAFSSPPAPGELINFSFTITNAGNVSLSDIQIMDTLAGLSTITYVWPGATGVLTPGESATATATYPITQADIDAGDVTNTAVAAGATAAGAQVLSNEPRTVTPVAQAPGIAITKTADATGVTIPAKPGDTIEYNFVITNTGNVTLTEVEIADQLAGLPPLTYTWPGADGVLPPRGSATATSTYAVTTADIASGAVVNKATASGVDPAASTVTSSPATTTTQLNAPPSGTEPPLAASGSSFPTLPLTLGALLIAFGLVAISLRRRPHH